MADFNSQVVAGMGAAALLVGEGGGIVFANERSRALLGRDLTGAILEPAAFEDDPPLLMSLAVFYGRSGAEGHQEVLVERGERGTRYLWASVSPAGGGNSLVLLQDMTQALNGSEALERIFSQLNHDLRSPLTSIAGGAELLLSGRVGPLDGVQRRLVTIIEDSSRKMQSILQETKDRFAMREAAVGGGGE